MLLVHLLLAILPLLLLSMLERERIFGAQT